MKDQIINALIVALMPIVLTLAVQAVIYVINKLREQSINVKYLNSSLGQRAVNKTAMVLQTIVESLNATIVKDLKQKAANGEITMGNLATELAAVKIKAWETAKTAVGDSTMQIVRHEIPEAEEYFLHAIEGYVEQLKKNTSTPSLPTATSSTSAAN